MYDCASVCVRVCAHARMCVYRGVSNQAKLPTRFINLKILKDF